MEKVFIKVFSNNADSDSHDIYMDKKSKCEKPVQEYFKSLGLKAIFYYTEVTIIGSEDFIEVSSTRDFDDKQMEQIAKLVQALCVNGDQYYQGNDLCLDISCSAKSVNFITLKKTIDLKRTNFDW